MSAEGETNKKNVRTGEAPTGGVDINPSFGGERKEIEAAFDELSAIDPELEDLLSSISPDQETLAGRIGSVKKFVREGGFKNTEKALGEDETLFNKVYMILGPEFVRGTSVRVRELCKTMEDIFRIVYESSPVIFHDDDVIREYLGDEEGEVLENNLSNLRFMAAVELARLRAQSPGLDLGNDDDKKVWKLLEKAKTRVKASIQR